MTELLTSKQRERYERDLRILGVYQGIKATHPKASDSRIWKYMAENSTEGITSYCGIRACILRAKEQQTA